MDYAEASAAIRRLSEIMQERPHVWSEGNGERYKELTSEEKELMKKLHDFYESLPSISG